MLLKDKNAIIYGAGGAIGSSITRAFIREGARVFMAGRHAHTLKAVADSIDAPEGALSITELDALDEKAVNRFVDEVAKKAGHIDISVNAIGIVHVQGRLFADLSLQDYMHPITSYCQTLFITAQAAARHMAKRGAGVLMSISTPGSKLPGPGYMGYGVTCAAIEAFNRQLAGELGANGIRSICLRSDAIPEALLKHSHSKKVFEEPARGAGVSIEEMLEAHAKTDTLLKRMSTLDELANVAVFMASDWSKGMTGTVMNMTNGWLVD